MYITTILIKHQPVHQFNSDNEDYVRSVVKTLIDIGLNVQVNKQDKDGKVSETFTLTSFLYEK